MPNPPQVVPSEVAELIRIARQHGLSELVILQDGAKIELRLAQPQEMGSPGAVIAIPAAVGHPPERTARLIPLLSPMTGVFFTSPAPGEPPFIHPGDILKEGDPIGLIEAMKVYSEVLADHSGRVRHVLAASGKLVQQGDILVELSPVDAADE